MSPKNNEKQHITLQEAFDEWHKINKSENDRQFASAFKLHILSRYKDKKSCKFKQNRYYSSF